MATQLRTELKLLLKGTIEAAVTRIALGAGFRVFRRGRRPAVVGGDQ